MEREQLIREFWKVAKNTERGEHYTRAVNHVIDLCQKPVDYQELNKKIMHACNYGVAVDGLVKIVRDHFEPKQKNADDYTTNELIDLLLWDPRPDFEIVAWIMGVDVEHASRYHRFAVKVQKGWTVEEASAYIRNTPFKTNPNSGRWRRAWYVVSERMKRHD